jgi:hypothetical protein
MSSIPWQFPKYLQPAFLTNAIGERVQRWARERQGGDSQVTRLQPKRIYILPTGVGFVFAIMTFAMLLGSMNYNNNLSFVLTFLLAGLGLVSMHQCQRNLVGRISDRATARYSGSRYRRKTGVTFRSSASASGHFSRSSCSGHGPGFTWT